MLMIKYLFILIICFTFLEILCTSAYLKLKLDIYVNYMFSNLHKSYFCFVLFMNFSKDFEYFQSSKALVCGLTLQSYQVLMCWFKIYIENKGEKTHC